MADRWEQFKRAKDVADAWAGWGAGVLMSPVDAVRDIATNYRPGPQNEPLNQDIGRQAFTAGPGAMMGPGMAGAASSALGATGGRILQRADAQNLVKEMLGQGKSAREVAEALNTRFAPLLDEGERVTKGMIEGRRHRGDYTVGAMGGRGPGGRVTPEDVQELATSFGYPPKTHVAESGTHYMHAGPKGDKLTVRVPTDAASHGGRRELVPHETTVTLDTADARRADPMLSRNAAGERYSDTETLRDAMKFHFSRGTPDDPNWLVPPGREPRYPGPVAKDVQLIRDEPDPRQLRLLSGGAPAPGNWQTTVEPAQEEPEGAGRFARPIMDQDAALIARARDMTERVRQQQRTIWDQFERVDAYDAR